MDSSNSGSFQSSSGGGGGDNDEYDSRTQSISSFFNNPSTNFNPNLNQLLQPQQQPSYQQQPNNTTFFNNNNNNNHNNPLHDAWTGTPTMSMSQDFTTYPVINPTHTKPGRGSDHQIGVSIKNPKKRTRASRRAPTTVLTTDTTNFRQMVQEFTGIPTAPFTTAPFTRRLDLFSSSGGGSLNPLRKININPQPQPSPQFLNNSTPTTNNTNNTTAATTSGNYNFAPSTITDFQKQPSTFLDLQNPMFSFQSLLQNSLPNQSNELSGLQSSSKRFEGVIGNTQNIGGSRSGSGGGDQVQGNEGSWICPSG